MGSGGVVGMVEAQCQRLREGTYACKEKIGKKQKRKKYILLCRYIILISRIGK